MRPGGPATGRQENGRTGFPAVAQVARRSDDELTRLSVTYCANAPIRHAALPGMSLAYLHLVAKLRGHIVISSLVRDVSTPDLRRCRNTISAANRTCHRARRHD